jgi:hypothetical protein
LATALGVAYVLGFDALFFKNNDVSLRMTFAAPFLVMFVVGLVLGRFASPKKIIGVFLFVGISVGVFAFASYDSFANGVDHNLFPVEIIVMSISGIPGLLAGQALSWLTLGRQLNRRRFTRGSNRH